MINGTSFGERIKNARVAKNLKQSEIAAAMGCAPTSLTNYENGKIQPPFDVLAKLCAVLEISALDLLDKRYSYADILRIANTPANERTYEQQVALNFCGAILEKAQDKELKRLDKVKENKGYISDELGLTPAAVDALSDATGLTAAALDAMFVDVFDAFDDNGKMSDSTITPAGLDALNRLLSCKEGLSALDSLGMYLNGGDFRYTDGVKTVRVEVPAFSAPGRTVDKAFYLTPDMTRAIFRDDFLRLIDGMKTRIPQEELDAAVTQFRADMEKRSKRGVS